MKDYSAYIAVIIVSALVICCGCGRNKSAAAVDSVKPVRRMSIVFGGDVMQHLPQVRAARRDSSYDYTETFRYIRPFTDSADIVVFNFETTISANGRYSGYPMFSSPAELMAALAGNGVDVVALANNHTADRGYKGLRATVDTAEKYGLKYTGAFADSTGYEANNPLMLESGGVKMALLNYTYGLNGLPLPKGGMINLIDTTVIARDIRKAYADSADIVTVFYHWGHEYQRRPNKEQRQLAQWTHSKGVRLVVGSHPHVLQPIEAAPDSLMPGAVTVYSLGNLVSNQRQRYTDGGMLIRFDIELRDSLPPQVGVSYMLTWVDVAEADGRTHYRILPSPIADTMLSARPQAEAAFKRFADDSRRLLGEDTTAVWIRECM